MTAENDKQDMINADREIEDRIANIILACGSVPLKDKVSMLYLAISYIFDNNKDIEAQTGSGQVNGAPKFNLNTVVRGYC